MERTYSTRVMCSMTGVTYRQADYWARCGAITPLGEGRGSGSYRRWTYEQVRVMAFLRVVAGLISNGENGGGRSVTRLLGPIVEQLLDDPTLLDLPGLYVDLANASVSLDRRPFAVWLPAWAYAVDVAADLVPA